MKILSRTQAIQLARIVSKHRHETIDASELNYEYLDVYPNGEVLVGISLCGFDEIYDFVIHDDTAKTISLRDYNE